MSLRQNSREDRLSPKASTLVDLLQFRASTEPDRLAYRFLIDGETEKISLTYRELDQQARAIGAWLQSREAAGKRVLLLYPPGLQYIGAFLGCLYAGAVAVPVYPPKLNRSQQRLETIASDSQAAIAVTTTAILSMGSQRFSQSPALKELAWLAGDDTGGAEEDWRRPDVSPETLAMLQYTSGSTGTPKGVMLSQANLLRNSTLLECAFEYGSQSCCVSWLPMYHDMGLVGGVIQPLHGGFPCTLMSPVSFLQRPVRWLEAISRYKATISGGPNFAYDLCVRKTTPEQRARLDLSQWTVAFNGSEPVRAETLARFSSAFEASSFRPKAFYPCYGLAEATLIVSGSVKGRGPVIKTVSTKALENHQVIEAAANDAEAPPVVGCGRILPDQKVVVVDPESLTACPRDKVGEIWVSGENVAQGYWERPEESRETFEACLSDTGEGPFLRTGDLGFMSGGELFITGRLKDLIIIRGLNHYPQDIEFTAERCHPAIRPGCGAAFTVDLEGAERLVAVLEVDVRQRPDYTRVIEDISQAIAEEHELQVEAVTLVKPGTILKTSSGKLQRYACREAFLSGTLEVVAEWRASVRREIDQSMSPAPPQTRERVEQWLIRQLVEKLGVDRSTIETDQPISRYGIDSLTAMELMHGIESELGAVLPMVSLLQSPSIGQLVVEVTARLNDPFAKTTALESGEAITEFPLSKGQQALWFLQQLNPASPAYNISVAARIRGKLDTAALRDTFETLVARHRTLRATFSAREGPPIQHINEKPEFEFEEISASTWDEILVSDRLIEESHRPFDLERGPLLRICLCNLSSNEHLLLLVVHHVVADFWSLSILMREMALLYPAIKEGISPKLAPLPAQYQDYIRWQEEMLAGPEGERLWRFWEKSLAGDLPVLNLPTDRPRPPIQTYKGASHSFEVNRDLTAKLKAIGRRHGATLNTTLLLAFQTLLHRHTGQEDILVGSLSAGRNRANLGSQVGYFVNPVIQRADLSGNPAFGVLLERTRQKALATLDHQDYPFALLVERLQPVRDPGRSPLFQVMFVLQKAPLLNNQSLAAFALGEEGARLEVGDLVLESYALKQRVAQFDLTLVMAETDCGLGGSFQYNTDLFNAGAIAQLAERFTTLLEAIVADPTRPISELAVLPQAEERRLLVEWNDTRADYQADLCIHQLFEDRVEQSPESLAVVSEHKRLTYAELNRRANQLAHRLRALRVGPETAVGIAMERSVDMVVALLGTLKSGGAYVPLDPTLPRERLAFMLEDAGAHVLLTQEQFVERLPAHGAKVVLLDSEWDEITREPDENTSSDVGSDNLCYLIYTSGSTGKPKGVMITHRNVVNFFAGMSASVGCDSRDTLLAVTSISFDISVLELLWTLVNGSRVVLLSDQTVSGFSTHLRPKKAHKEIQFSLFYFATDDSEIGQGKYRLLLEGAKFADRNGFAAVWSPERHFHAFGGLYPNPSVTSAALSTITESVHIRGGSVVMPLHHPIRVAEEWSLVDNLSNGRVGIAFASGWHSDDFAFYPQNYDNRKEAMIRGIETVRKLWRGESVMVLGGAGNEIEVKIYPKPIQPELPIWLTAAGAPDTFIKAGELGANVLTHLLGQTPQEVASKIRLYRESLAKHGRDPRKGQVTLMLHTFLGESREEVKEKVREPFTNYLRSSVGLIANMIKSLNLPLDLGTMSAKDMDDLLAYAFDRYFETSALFGTPETCEPLIESLKEMGVDEVACLIDFGVDADSALASLPYVRVLMNRANARQPVEDFSVAAQARRYGASLMQCTPSMMSMLSLNSDTVFSLKSLRTLMLGGEALPPKLARQVKEMLPARLLNMYGPTETTVWSATHEVARGDETAPIGRPIANTQMYLLDSYLQPVPGGVEGELYIGGAGVARGYLDRPDLTADKFMPDPFGGEPGARLYKTGDLARHRPDGKIEFMGRLDHQVKLRGFRIELGEIEAIIGQHESVREAVVIAREDTIGDRRLVAYVVASQEAGFSTSALRGYLKQRLPDYMAPSSFVKMDALPQTANGKVDRKALPLPDTLSPDMKPGYASPRNKLEQTIAGIWQEVLKVDKVGIHDNFFDSGGHSLLMAQVHSKLRGVVKEDLPLVKILEHPTISSLAKYLSEERSEQLHFQQEYERAKKQREGLRRQKQPLKAHGSRD